MMMNIITYSTICSAALHELFVYVLTSAILGLVLCSYWYELSYEYGICRTPHQAHDLPRRRPPIEPRDLRR